MGKNITLVGGNGDGQTTKVANQIIVALNIEAVAEALLFAAKAGADPARVRQALMGGFASSKILEVHGERMVKRTFDPGFRIELHQKDLNLALSSARQMGVSLPNTATAQELFNSCAAHGGVGVGPLGDGTGARAPGQLRNRTEDSGLDKSLSTATSFDVVRRLFSQATGYSRAMDTPRELLRRMFDAAIAAAQPALCLPAHLPPRPAGRTDRDRRRQGVGGDGARRRG